jgi:cobalt-zinc-cadmium efflux system membrane fusion protein
MGMEIKTLEESNFDQTVKASGKVDVPPQHQAQVTPFVAGYVKNILVNVGDRVAKGQPLLQLESPEYIDWQQSYLDIAGQMDYLKVEYERQQTLYDEKISSAKVFLEAESEYNRAKAAYNSLKEKLTLLHISPSEVEQGKISSAITLYAPIGGYVTTIHASVNMALTATDVTMEIIDPAAVYLDLSVFEKDVLQLKVGQKTTFTIPQVSDETWSATVTQIGKSVTANDRIIHVYASPGTEVKERLLAGMFVEAAIIVGSKQALSVPFDAVITEEGHQFILVNESDRDNAYTFRKTLVQTGVRVGDRIEVIPDEKTSTQTKVLTKGVYDVK